MAEVGFRQVLRADFDHFHRLCHVSEGRSLWRMTLNPRTLPVCLIRLAQKCEKRPVARIFAPFIRLWILWWFRIELPANSEIGPGLVLPHPGNIVFGAAYIGKNAIIFQNVTLGARQFDIVNDHTTRPCLKDNVTVGAGATVVGPITLHDSATVGANSLVLNDVPALCTAIGVPAEIKNKARS